MSSFDTAFDRVIGNEGAFQDDYADRGNWTSGEVGVGELKGTKFGLAAMTYPDLDMINITVEMAKHVYKIDWWDKLKLDLMPPSMQFQFFDAAINHGVYNASRIVQWAIKVKADGIVGRKTRAALLKLDHNDLLMQFLAERLVFMTGVKTWNRYGKGWARRIAHNLVIASEDN